MAPGLAGNEHLALPADADQVLRSDGDQVVKALERAFAQSFSVVDASTGHVVRTAEDDLPVDRYKRIAELYEIAQRGRPEMVDEVSPLLFMAVPLPTNPGEAMLVAVTTFVTEPIAREEQIRAAALEFGVDAAKALQWAQGRIPWHPHAVLEVSAAVVDKASLQLTQAQLKRQLADLSSHLLTTFEEITLLHRLTEKLSISKSV